MDTNLTLIVSLAIATSLIMGALMAAVSVSAIRKTGKDEPLSINGEDVAVQVNRASDTATINAGGVTKTDIQVYEDALAKLTATNDAIVACHEVIEAVQSGLFRGDLTENLNVLLREARNYTELGTFILQRGRAGEYDYHTTEGDLSKARENNGKQ
jgi:hypothetical protein